jgi:DNA polymerase-3 subunit beta
MVMSNSEQADYDADIDCETQGDGLTIAFNQKYIMNTMNVIGTEEAVMKFNSPLAPCIICGREESGIHLVLPVRTAG